MSTTRRSSRRNEIRYYYELEEESPRPRSQRRCAQKATIDYCDESDLDLIYVENAVALIETIDLTADKREKSTKTPRKTHRKPEPSSPTFLLSNLSLVSPQKASLGGESVALRTPRKEKSKEATHATPPKLQKRENDENVPKNPPPTPNPLFECEIDEESTKSESSHAKKQLFDSNDKFRSARKALHSKYPTEMPGRKDELIRLRDFITQHLDNSTSGTLYVSGPPGTGKTASLNLILQESEISDRIKYVYVNCTSIKSSGAIFARIVQELDLKPNGRSERDQVDAIRRHLRHKHKQILLVLDEIDQLESKKQAVLYTIFEWPAIESTKLILIGIANALDLTDRILPRLQARCELKPELLHFSAYTKPQIVEIFTKRLETAGVLDIFNPVAIQMLAGKVAAISGDVRRALNIGRRVIEIVEREGGGALKSIENYASQLEVERCEQQTKVELKQVVDVLSNVYGTSGSSLGDDDEFPLQQKIVICCLMLMLKKARNRDVTVGRLFEVYRRVCLKRNIQVVDECSFLGLCELIETRGVLRLLKKKEARMSKVSLVWDEEEVGCSLKDKQLMSSIFLDVDCLGKM